VKVLYAKLTCLEKHAPLAMIEIASDEHVTFIVNLTEVHRGIIFVNALKHINVLTSKF